MKVGDLIVPCYASANSGNHYLIVEKIEHNQITGANVPGFKLLLGDRIIAWWDVNYAERYYRVIK